MATKRNALSSRPVISLPSVSKSSDPTVIRPKSPPRHTTPILSRAPKATGARKEPSPFSSPRVSPPCSLTTSPTSNSRASTYPPSPPSPLNHTMRCVCFKNKEQGNMIECEECRSWLHNKCAHVPSSVPPDYPFICPFCVRNTSLQVKSLRHELSQISKSVQSLEQSINTSIPHPVKAQFDSVLSGLHLISSKLSQLSTSLSQTPPANPPSQSSPPHPLTDYPPNPPSPPHPSPVSLSNPPPHSLSPPKPLSSAALHPTQKQKQKQNSFLSQGRPPRKPSRKRALLPTPLFPNLVPLTHFSLPHPPQHPPPIPYLPPPCYPPLFPRPHHPPLLPQLPPLLPQPPPLLSQPPQPPSLLPYLPLPTPSHSFPPPTLYQPPWLPLSHHRPPMTHRGR